MNAAFLNDTVSVFERKLRRKNPSRTLVGSP